MRRLLFLLVIAGLLLLGADGDTSGTEEAAATTPAPASVEATAAPQATVVPTHEMTSIPEPQAEVPPPPEAVSPTVRVTPEPEPTATAPLTPEATSEPTPEPVQWPEIGQPVRLEIPCVGIDGQVYDHGPSSGEYDPLNPRDNLVAHWTGWDGSPGDRGLPALLAAHVHQLFADLVDDPNDPNDAVGITPDCDVFVTDDLGNRVVLRQVGEATPYRKEEFPARELNRSVTGDASRTFLVTCGSSSDSSLRRGDGTSTENHLVTLQTVRIELPSGEVFVPFTGA